MRSEVVEIYAIHLSHLQTWSYLFSFNPLMPEFFFSVVFRDIA